MDRQTNGAGIRLSSPHQLTGFSRRDGASTRASNTLDRNLVVPASDSETSDMNVSLSRGNHQR